MKKNCKKLVKKKIRKKVLKRKGDKLYTKWNQYNSFIVGLLKKTLYKNESIL